MLSRHLLLLISIFIIGATSECPQDPFDCLIGRENKLEIDSLLKKLSSSSLSPSSANLDKDQNNKNNNKDRNQDNQEFNDGRFSLNDTLPADCNLDGDGDQTEITRCNKKCSVCPKNGIKIQDCNQSQSTQCICKSGSYLSIMTYECKACSSCPHGFGVWKSCSRSRNTICRKCPPGTFSGVLSGTLGCVLCTSCKSDQVMLQECSRIQDTVCVDKSLSQRNHFLIGKSIIRDQNQDSTLDNNIKTNDEMNILSTADLDQDPLAKYYRESPSLTIYLAFLAILVAGLIIYVSLKWKFDNSLKSKLGASPNKVGHFYLKTGSSYHHNRSMYSPLAQQNPHRPTTMTTVMIDNNSVAPNSNSPYLQVSSNSSNFARNDLNRPSLCFRQTSSLSSTRYVDMMTTKKRAFENLMNQDRNDGNDWRKLSFDLGFQDKDQLDHFDNLGKVKHGPTRHLLQSWNKKEGKNATVGKLISILLKMQRIDAAFILDPTCLLFPENLDINHAGHMI